MSTPPPNANSRASLLAGLRTGGVRSTSAGGNFNNIPHTAAPGGSFNVPRFTSQRYNNEIFPEEEEDELPEMPSQNVFPHSLRQAPQTAAVDGPNNRFAQQQRGMNPNSVPFNPSFSLQHAQQQQQIQQQQQLQMQQQQQLQQQQQQQIQQQQQQQAQNQANNQAMQMQLMQLEILRLQAIQAQQYQKELLSQAQIQNQNRRSSLHFNPPASAGPLQTGFDLRAAAAQAQARRASHVELNKLQTTNEDQVPMTAALGGRFGTRATSLGTSALARYSDDSGDESYPPPTPVGTTVISGGTSLGAPSSGVTPVTTRSDADVAISWRRGGASSANSRPLNVKVTPPPSEAQRASPPLTATKARPIPLRIGSPNPATTVAADSANDSTTDNEDTYSTSSSKSGGGSSPTTPRSVSSNDMPSISPRAEAAKKLYDGLGVGRPAPGAPAMAAPPAMMVNYRLVSQPMRQPRGPPSGSEELGPMNFASRIRRKAIGGLGMLMGARERREIVDVY